MLGGRYRLTSLIGAGGMAEVFRGRDEQLCREVAVKVFRPQPDEQHRHRIEVEVRALATTRHQNLTTLFDAQIDGDPSSRRRPYLVMEYVDGGSLARRIEAPLPVAEVAGIAAGVTSALRYVHGLQIVHRDVTPANILLGSDGRARLTDFGVALLPDDRPSHATRAALFGGTAAYLSPEQARGAAIGPASDVYSLALVLLEAFTGERCFRGPSEEAALERLSRSPVIPADLPRPWPCLLTAMTALDPGHRPTAREIDIALREGYYEPVVPVGLLGRLTA